MAFLFVYGRLVDHYNSRTHFFLLKSLLDDLVYNNVVDKYCCFECVYHVHCTLYIAYTQNAMT